MIPIVRRVGAVVAATALVVVASPPADAGSGGELVVSGRLETLPLENGTDHVARFVRLRDGSAVPVRFPGISAQDLPAEGRVSGTVALSSATDLTTRTGEGRALARSLSERGALSLSGATVTPEVAPAQQTPTAHHAYVAIVDNVGSFDGVTDQNLLDRVDEATDFWVDQSDGIISSFDVAQTEHVDSAGAASVSDCGLDNPSQTIEIFDEISDEFPGVDFQRQPNHLLIMLPDECEVHGTIGRGRLGTSLASGGLVLFHAERPDAVSTLAHELGHNVGLMHANLHACSPSDPASCVGGEYFDYYDVMGHGGGEVQPVLNTVHRADLGLLSPDETQVFRLSPEESEHTMTARIRPRGDATGQRSVTVVDPEDGRTYYLDYRSGTGGDVGADYVTRPPNYLGISFGTGLTVVSSNPDRSSTLWANDIAMYEHRSSFQEGETFRSSGDSVVVHVDAIEPGQYMDVTVTVQTDLPPLADPPAPELLGDAVVGSSLTVDPGWDSWPYPTFMEVRWIVDGLPTYKSIFDQDDALYLYNFMRGSTVQAEVTMHPEGYRTVVMRTPEVTITHPISGFLDIWAYPVAVGEPVSSTLGTAVDDEAHEVTYQWFADGDEIEGADEADYTPVAEDEGAMLQLEAVVTADGWDDTTLTSNELGPVEPGFVVGSPSLSGTARVGKTLTAEPGTWTSGTDFAYQWTRGGSPITGADRKTYKLTAKDLDKEIAVEVTGDHLDFAPMTVASEAVLVDLGILKTVQPYISGVPKVGSKLLAVRGEWTSGTTYAYQWSAGTSPIAGATKSTYKPTRSVKGKKISVTVTGSKPAYTTVSLTSLPTRKVR